MFSFWGDYRLDIELLRKEDLVGVLHLAADVERLFGPMVATNGFQDAVLRAAEEKQAFCVRNELDGKTIIGAVFVSRAQNQITWLAVHSSERHQGYGEALIQQAIGALDPHRPITVRTFADTTIEGRPARRLYQKHGFNETGKAGINPAGFPTVFMTRPAQLLSVQMTNNRYHDITVVSQNEQDKVAALFRDCTIAMVNKQILQWDEYYPTAQLIEDDIRQGCLFALRNSDALLGVITLNDQQSLEYQELQWSDSFGRILVIHRLAVTPAYQGQGIGKKLMTFAEDYARQDKYTSIRLDAYSGNPGAIHLYENIGYQKVGQIRFPRRDLPFNCYEKIL